MTHRYDIPERVMLHHHVAAMLTTSEMNEYSDFIRPQKAWVEYDAARRNVSVLEAAVLGGAVERTGELAAEKKAAADLEILLIGLARKWYADLLAKDEHPVTDIVGTDSAKYDTKR